jgi:hypothetical protein
MAFSSSKVEAPQITGSLFGTASWAVSASWAPSNGGSSQGVAYQTAESGTLFDVTKSYPGLGPAQTRSIGGALQPGDVNVLIQEYFGTSQTESMNLVYKASTRATRSISMGGTGFPSSRMEGSGWAQVITSDLTQFGTYLPAAISSSVETAVLGGSYHSSSAVSGALYYDAARGQYRVFKGLNQGGWQDLVTGGSSGGAFPFTGSAAVSGTFQLDGTGSQMNKFTASWNGQPLQAAAAFGANNEISASWAYAFGQTNKVAGPQSMAIGGLNFIGQNSGVSFAAGSSNLITASVVVGTGGGAQVAMGYRVTSSAVLAIAIGTAVHAAGTSSFAQGGLYTRSGSLGGGNTEILASGGLALGGGSHAEGLYTTAIGVASHAEGGGFVQPLTGSWSSLVGIPGGIAIGSGSHAEGRETTAIGNWSHAEGFKNAAIGLYSHTEGANNTATGVTSHAEGLQTSAIGQNSHTEGELVKAFGQGSHAEGHLTTTIGEYSHAEGRETTTIGNWSHAQGLDTVALGEYQFVAGQFNQLIPSSSAFIVGDGTSDSARKNLIYASGGRVDISGSLYINGTQVTSGGGGGGSVGTLQEVTTAGNQTSQSIVINGSLLHGNNPTILGFGLAGHVEGTDSFVAGFYAHAEGSGTTAKGNYSHAEGVGSKALGQGSHAEGFSSTAIGASSYTHGYLPVAHANYSRAEGWLTNAYGEASRTEGFFCTTDGRFAHAEGDTTAAWGTGSHSEGLETKAQGNHSHAEGIGTIAISQGQHAQGQFNRVISGSGTVIIGNGTSNGSRSNLLFASGSQVQITGSLLIQSASVNGEAVSNIGDTYTSTQKVTKMVTCTSAEYAAIGTKDPNTFYIVI